jgi:hypothetical protein
MTRFRLADRHVRGPGLTTPLHLPKYIFVVLMNGDDL